MRNRQMMVVLKSKSVFDMDYGEVMNYWDTLESLLKTETDPEKIKSIKKSIESLEYIQDTYGFYSNPQYDTDGV